MSWPLDLFDKVLIVSKIHLLTESSIQWLKQQAKALKKSKSIALSQAQYEIALQHGFSNWKHLIETFKYETNFIVKYRKVRTYSPDYEPIQKEAYNLYLSRIDYSPTVEPDYSNLFTDNPNLNIYNTAFLETAKKYGFSNWDELRLFHETNEVLSEYTAEQKIGAITRNLGINPKNIENSIFLTIENSEDVFNIDIDEWESLGFYEDFSFVKWIERNDPYFKEFGIEGQIFRVLSIDTNSHKIAQRKIERILDKMRKKHDFFFPIIHGFVWINGKIDPQSVEVDPEYPNDLLPLAELPESAWKRGY